MNMKHLFFLVCLSFSLSLSAQTKSAVLINEIMANPKGLTLLPETEYVELHNVSQQPISLAGWRFCYGDKEVQLTALELPANGYVVLYRAGRILQVDQGGLQMSLEKFPAQLSNEGKQLALYDASFSLQDEIAYPKAKAAISWERKGNELLLSKDARGGTPGSLNSVESESPADPDEPALPDTPIDPDEPTPTYSYGSIRINEIMADPKGMTQLPETEYVELLNQTNEAISLQDWQFLYGEKVTTLTAYTLPAHGYVVLYRAGRTISVSEKGGSLPLEKFPSALVNTGKELALCDPNGKEVDRITYGKAKAGIAWERSKEGLYLSTDPKGGTPGAPNSTPAAPPTEEEPDDPDEPDTPTEPDTPNQPEQQVQPGEIIFNELLPAPYNEGNEYIELYNRSDQVLSLAGLALTTRKTDGSLGVHYPLSAITGLLEPDDYALLSKRLAGVENFYHIASPQALHEVKLPILSNNGATLVLFRLADEVVIDEVSYSSKWHDATIKDPKGVALERIDPDRPSQEASNWHSAAEAAGYGTPGYENSQQTNEPTATEGMEGFEPPSWSATDRIYQLSYQFAEAGYHCRIWIFDTAGRRVAEVANLTTLATEGSLQWNGLAQDGSRPKPGVYVCYVEWFHPNGTTHTQREVFLVH